MAAQRWAAGGHRYHAAVCRLRVAEAQAALGDRHAARRSQLRRSTPPANLALSRVGPADRATPSVNGRLADQVGSGGQTAGPLTHGELDVLGLISLGRKNKPIAVELFISPKAAAIHVSRILAKLGPATEPKRSR